MNDLTTKRSLSSGIVNLKTYKKIMEVDGGISSKIQISMQTRSLIGGSFLLLSAANNASSSSSTVLTICTHTVIVTSISL